MWIHDDVRFARAERNICCWRYVLIIVITWILCCYCLLFAKRRPRLWRQSYVQFLILTRSSRIFYLCNLDRIYQIVGRLVLSRTHDIHSTVRRLLLSVKDGILCREIFNDFLLFLANCMALEVQDWCDGVIIFTFKSHFFDLLVVHISIGYLLIVSATANRFLLEVIINLIWCIHLIRVFSV